MIVPISQEMHPQLIKIALQEMGAMYQPELYEELDDIERGKCFGLCKLENGKPVGYVIAKKTIDAFHLLTIAVDIEHRGRGYGSLLINSIFNEIEKKGGRILNVITDAEANESIRFYLKNSFVLAGIVQDEFISGVAQVHLTKRAGYNPEKL